MKLPHLLSGVCLAVMSYSALTAEPAPVIDATSTSNTAGRSVSLQEQLQSLERKLDARNRAQIAVQRQLDELQNEVNELRGVTELHTHQLSQILERQRELYQELDRRVSQALKPQAQVSAVVESPVQPPQEDYSADISENEAYDSAVNLVLKAKEYDKAIPAFQRFIEQYPNSTYSANAHYWLGQLLFTKGKLAEAKQAFNVVVSQYTNSSKRSDAILKLATVEQKQNNNARAISLYQQLIKEYPQSSAAKLAQPRLDALL
jgi:tol-pal system protein YbgF